MSTREITILGAGIFGLSVAWACLRRGASVRVIEKRRIGAGSSGGIVGALAPHTPENWNEKKAFQFESLLMAEEWWAEIVEVSGLDPGYARTGRVQPIADARALDLAHQRAETAKALWQGRAVWQVEEAGANWCPASPTGQVIRDTLSARLHPRQATLALAEAIRRCGGVIDEGVTGDPDGVVVEATGYEGLLALAARLDQPVGNGVKGQAVLLRHEARALPQVFADGLHVVPHGDGTVAIGSTSERDWTEPEGTDALLDDLLSRAIAALPELAGADMLERWAGVRPRARSRAPMLGPDPERPDRYIANGGFKIGFGMAPKIGEVMADLVLEGRDDIPGSFRVGASLR